VGGVVNVWLLCSHLRHHVHLLPGALVLPKEMIEERPQACIDSCNHGLRLSMLRVGGGQDLLESVGDLSRVELVKLPEELQSGCRDVVTADALSMLDQVLTYSANYCVNGNAAISDRSDERVPFSVETDDVADQIETSPSRDAAQIMLHVLLLRVDVLVDSAEVYGRKQTCDELTCLFPTIVSPRRST